MKEPKYELETLEDRCFEELASWLFTERRLHMIQNCFAAARGSQGPAVMPYCATIRLLLPTAVDAASPGNVRIQETLCWAHSEGSSINSQCLFSS